MTADAVNNLSDASSSVVTLIGFHLAGKPADESIHTVTTGWNICRACAWQR